MKHPLVLRPSRAKGLAAARGHPGERAGALPALGQSEMHTRDTQRYSGASDAEGKLQGGLVV